MSIRQLLTANLLLLAVVAAPVTVAHAQTASELEQQLQAQTDDSLGGATDGGATDAPATDDALSDPVPTTPATTTDPATVDPATPAVATPTPVPPAYLSPGSGALAQPVSAVRDLTDPAVPAEPLRIAALIAALLALIAVGTAALLRSLGLRSPVTTPVPLTPGGRRARLSERASLITDDLRDFLRRSR